MTIESREQSLERSQKTHARLPRFEDAQKPLVAAIVAPERPASQCRTLRKEGGAMTWLTLWVAFGLGVGGGGAATDGAQPATVAAQSVLWWVPAGPRLTVFDDTLAKKSELDAGLNVTRVSSRYGRVAVASIGAYTSRVALMSGRREFWPEAGATSSVTVLDAAALQVLAKRTVPFRPMWTEFVNSETLVVISAGQLSGNEEKQILPAVTILRAPAWEAQAPIQLKTNPLLIWSPEGSSLVHIGCETFGKRPAELVSIDVARGDVRRTPMPEDLYALSPTGDETSRYILLERSVRVLDAQGKLSPPIPIPGKSLVLFSVLPGTSRYLLGARSGKTATLQIIERGAVTKTLDLPGGLERVVYGPKTNRVYACGKKTAIVFDATSFEQVRSLTIPDDYADVLLDPAERRLFVFEGGALSAVDVTGNAPATRIGIGSGLKKFMQAGEHLIVEGGGFREPPAADEASEVTTLVFSASGNHAFVYNTVARDISIVDTAGFTVKQKVDVGDLRRSDLWRLPGGQRLLALRGKRVMLFDLENGTLLTDREFPDSRVFWSASAGLLFVRSPQNTVALRTDSLQPAHDFGGEAAVPASVLKDDLGMMFSPRARRFVMTTTSGLKMYDYDLKAIGALAGVTRMDGLFRTGGEAEKPPN